MLLVGRLVDYQSEVSEQLPGVSSETFQIAPRRRTLQVGSREARGLIEYFERLYSRPRFPRFA